MLLAATTWLSANDVTYYFKGTINTVPQNLQNSISVGEEVTGSFTVDEANPGESAYITYQAGNSVQIDGNASIYDITSGTVNVPNEYEVQGIEGALKLGSEQHTIQLGFPYPYSQISLTSRFLVEFDVAGDDIEGYTVNSHTFTVYDDIFSQYDSHPFALPTEVSTSNANGVIETSAGNVTYNVTYLSTTAPNSEDPAGGDVQCQRNGFYYTCVGACEDMPIGAPLIVEIPGLCVWIQDNP